MKQGGIVVQDCLSLLANLIRFNASNQTTFRETGGVANFASLLIGSPQSNAAKPGSTELDDWTSPQSEKNVWGLLAILRMFLVKGSTSTMPNQNAFEKHGLIQRALSLAFDSSTSVPIRVEVGQLSCLCMLLTVTRLSKHVPT